LISTALTQQFGLSHPIVLAPMGAISGGKLAAAVSNAGGLGLLGGGYGDADWVRRELEEIKAGTQRAWGIGFITWSLTAPVLELALAGGPSAVMLSFGDPRPYAPRIKAAGAKLICQVQDLEGARIAKGCGADFIVAQGTEAGGHGASRATLPLVPAVVDLVAPIPVVAAGGIADGRGLAAALMLGAAGALLGTRFYASHEALGSANAKRAIASANGGQTLRTRVFDVVRKLAWPEVNTGRAIRNSFTDRWHGREDELRAALDAESPKYWEANAKADVGTSQVWAGEAVDLIGEVESAADLVTRLGTDAARLLRAGPQLLAS
jgi:nitronate monooxygenase